MPDETLGTVEISALIESSSNPRRNLNGPELAELVQSVKEHGVLQPILVRRLPAGCFEIVAGHRRVAAAKKAALLTVPAMFRTLTDKQVLEIQIIENLQRSDLHPLEEADGYRQLIDKHGYTAEQLADRVGKSKGYIYARMKLVALVKGPRAAFLDGKLDASTALLIARMPEQLQEKATKEILTGGDFGGNLGAEPMTYRTAANYVRENFMLKLSAAPFDPKDAELVKAAGACGSCPKRTGNQPELFGDVKSADVCTDPICFKAKSEASWRLRAAEAKAAGRLVIEGVIAKKLFPWGQGDLRDDKFIDLKDYAGDLGEYQKTWSQVIGKKLDPAKLVLARDPEGRMHELVKRSDLPEILKAAGVKKKTEPSHRGGGSWRKQQAKQAREAKVRKIRGRAMVEAVLAKAAESSFAVDEILPIIAEGMLSHSWHDCVAETVRRRGVEISKGQGPENGLRKVIADLAEKDRARFYRELVLELVITRAMPQTYNPSPGRELQVAAKIYGIDLKKIGDRAVATTAKPKPAKKVKKT